jgi:3-oxoacyl-[acyl-carrier-protein] synthase-3
MKSTAIIGTGSYIPELTITNKDLEDEFSGGTGAEMFTDEWISTNFGIKERHWAYNLKTGEKKELNSDMATKAIRSALENANIRPEEVDMLICATASPDKLLPPMVVTIQEKLGIKECACIETRSACSGLVQAMLVADPLIKNQEFKTIVIVGSEFPSAFYEVAKYENILDEWINKIMFGDGAGAVVLRGVESERGGIIASTLNSVGYKREPALQMPFGGSENIVRKESDNATPYLIQDFRAIHAAGSDLFERALGDILKKAGLHISDVDYFIPHQASKFYLEHLIDVFKIPEEKMIVDLDKVANTGSAAIFIALDHTNRKHHLKDGDVVILLAAEATKWLYGGVALKWVC